MANASLPAAAKATTEREDIYSLVSPEEEDLASAARSCMKGQFLRVHALANLHGIALRRCLSSGEMGGLGALAGSCLKGQLAPLLHVPLAQKLQSLSRRVSRRGEGAEEDKAIFSSFSRRASSRSRRASSRSRRESSADVVSRLRLPPLRCWRGCPLALPPDLGCPLGLPPDLGAASLGGDCCAC